MSISDVMPGGHEAERSQAAPRVAGSFADLYPRLAAMQRTLDAASFVVLTARAATAISPGVLSVQMAGPSGEADMRGFLNTHSAFFLSHLRNSPLPVGFDADAAHPLGTGGAAGAEADTAGKREGLAFPVRLGAMGNGYTVFFGVGNAASPEMLIDLHRKSVVIMREALKLEFNSVAAFDNLNDREIECLQMVGDGMKSEAIGEKLNLSVHTVNAYLGSATTKLDAVNRIQAIAKAIRLGLIG